MIQQQRAKHVTKRLQLPIWSIAHMATRHHPKTFKGFCMCYFIHLPNRLFKEHLTEVWQEAKSFQLCSSQEVENCTFEASKEKQYIYTSHFQHSKIFINILFSQLALWHVYLKKASLYIFIISVYFLPLPTKFRQVTWLGRLWLDMLCLITKPLFSQNCCYYLPSNLNNPQIPWHMENNHFGVLITLLSCHLLNSPLQYKLKRTHSLQGDK